MVGLSLKLRPAKNPQSNTSIRSSCAKSSLKGKFIFTNNWSIRGFAMIRLGPAAPIEDDLDVQVQPTVTNCKKTHVGHKDFVLQRPINAEGLQELDRESVRVAVGLRRRRLGRSPRRRPIAASATIRGTASATASASGTATA